MAEHPNAALFRRGYEAFQTGDLETVSSLFAPDIVWRVPGRNHLSGEYHGVGETLGQFQKNFEETNGTFRVELHDVLGSDDHAVALATVTGEREGKRLEDRYAHMVHIKDGKVTESWIFNENPDKVDEFWG